MIEEHLIAALQKILIQENSQFLDSDGCMSVSLDADSKMRKIALQSLAGEPVEITEFERQRASVYKEYGDPSAVYLSDRARYERMQEQLARIRREECNVAETSQLERPRA
jgi:hypothetical protein